MLNSAEAYLVLKVVSHLPNPRSDISEVGVVEAAGEVLTDEMTAH